MNKIFLLLIIILHIFILGELVFFPYPELFIYPYLTNQGLKPYAQILDQHFPGLMFLPINLDNLGMNDESSARLWLFGIVLITHLLLYFISKNILGKKRALLVNFLYLIWQPFFEGWVLWIDNFLPLLLLPAFYFTLRKKLFWAGIFLGLGVVMKQSIIPLAGLVFLYVLFEKDFKLLWKYTLGGIIPVGLMLLFILSQGYLSDFWYWNIVFNLTTYAQSGTQVPRNFGFLSRLVLIYSTSLLVFFHHDRQLKIILGIFLVGSLVTIFDRANFVHLQPSLPFVIIATVLGFYSLAKNQISLILLGLYLTVTVWWQVIFYRGHISNMVFFFDPQTKNIASKIMEYTNPYDKIFVFGAAPHLYQMSQTLPAGDVFIFQFPWFLKVAENRVLEGLIKDAPEIVVVDRTVKIEDEALVDFASKLDRYILENYQEIDKLGNTQIMKKI